MQGHVEFTVDGASVSVVTHVVVAVWFCQCFAPSSDRNDDDLLCVSESRAPARRDAVWILGNLRLSGHQHEGGRILRLVDVVIGVVCFRYVVGFAVAWFMRRASVHADVFPILLGE